MIPQVETSSFSELMLEISSGSLELGGARMALLDIESGFWGIRRQIEALIGTKLAGSVIQQAGVNGGASFAKSFTGQTDVNTSTAFTACINAYQAAGFGKFEIIKIEWPLGRIQIRATDAIEAWMYQQHQQRGKCKMAAIGVCMHKILRIVYGMLKHQKPFDPLVDTNNRQRKKEKGNQQTKNKDRRFQSFDPQAPISKRQNKKRLERKEPQCVDNTVCGVIARVPEPV